VSGAPRGGGERRLADGARVARRPGVLSRALEGETILLDPDAGTYYALNEVGSRVWDLAAAGPSVAAIRHLLLAELTVDEETLARDLDDLLARLAAEGLVEVREPVGGEESAEDGPDD